MKIIYIFRNNDYAAILAAYIHLKINIPPNLEQAPLKKMKLYYMGVDEEQRQVYLLKYSMKKHILMNILHGVGNIFNEGIRIIELKRFDGFLNNVYARYTNQYKMKKYRKELEDYIHENNL
ncbi:DUF3189 family protein [Alkaliphilus hydrothermalis]|uniref:TFIIF-interacting CTD phosphatase-like protein n=1 Tax=Alkaliphilus hydrothermalis TaxID=1482730 RepID=A0ABS2NNP8_9FIRM|nr:DUF3189 family protein [Alkaliphilus hydrothermalis]MBM7614568.1 TFIIF-interacting CTD phosphatase-like protein [Alkaliphilus hydrothermalis]